MIEQTEFADSSSNRASTWLLAMFHLLTGAPLILFCPLFFVRAPIDLCWLNWFSPFVHFCSFFLFFLFFLVFVSLFLSFLCPWLFFFTLFIHSVSLICSPLCLPATGWLPFGELAGSSSAIVLSWWSIKTSRTLHCSLPTANKQQLLCSLWAYADTNKLHTSILKRTALLIHGRLKWTSIDLFVVLIHWNFMQQ